MCRVVIMRPRWRKFGVAMAGLTIRICLEDFRQTCLGRVVGVWESRVSIGFLIFYGSKFNVGWFGCHPVCNESRKYNRVLQLSTMSKSCINAFKKQNSDNTKGGNNKETFLIDEFEEGSWGGGGGGGKTIKMRRRRENNRNEEEEEEEGKQ